MARKKAVTNTEVAPSAVEKAPEQVQEKKFEPVIYASRGKALTLWVDQGKKKIQFNSNGIVGVYIAKSAEDVKLIEEENTFKNGEAWRVNGEPKGEGKPVVSGPRSSLTQAKTLPVDPEIQKIVAESNTVAKRPVSAE